MATSSSSKVAIISHTPTQEQGSWVELTPDLKKVWINIPPQGGEEEVFNHLRPILNWLSENTPGTIWCQGEMTAVAVIWDWARNNGCKAVVATTERCSVETTEPDGSVVKRAVFKHCRFREVPL